MESDSAEVQDNKLRLFWSVYCLDKGLSLRLGRASIIQDYDISSVPTFNQVDLSELWKSIYTLWIVLSRIQGDIYELLYSPRALRQPEAERTAHARRLASEMQEFVMEPFRVCISSPTYLPAASMRGMLKNNIAPKFIPSKRLRNRTSLPEIR